MPYTCQFHRTSDIYEQIFNSDSHPGMLNTPSPPVIDQDDGEDGVEFNVNNESTSLEDLMTSFTTLTMSSNIDLIVQKTDTIMSDVQELKASNRTIEATLHQSRRSNRKTKTALYKQEKLIRNMKAQILRQRESITRITKALVRQERSHENIARVLKQILQATTLNNRDSSRFVQSNRNGNSYIKTTEPLLNENHLNSASEFQLSINERPMSCSNQEDLINRTRDSTENNEERPTTSLPSDSNFRTVEKDRSQLRLTTTTANQFNSHDHLLYRGDAIDKIRSEKNRGKIQIGQWCYEINVGTTDDAPALMTATKHVPPTIPVQHENPSESTEDRETATSNLINYQLSRQLTTTNEHSVNIFQNGSPRICLLHPLKDQINGKTDERNTKLKDCFDNSPVLLIFNGGLPDNIRIEMAMIFTSSKGYYHSVYRFPDGKKGYNDFDSRLVKISSDQLQKIELNNIKVCKRRNNNMRNEEIFLLKRYPSGEIENTMIDAPKDLNEQYKFKNIRLAVRFFQDKTLLLNGTIFYSNFLHGVSKIGSSYYHLDISTRCSSGTVISFDNTNQCPMEFLIKIPEPFHCTLISGYKWFEISIITNDILNTVYSIDTGNGKTTNPNYINIKQSSFKMSLKIIKQTLAELMNNRNIRDVFYNNQSERQTDSSITYDITMNNINSVLKLSGFHVFQLQFRLLHCVGDPHASPKAYYTNCAIWKTQEFTEDITNSSISEGLVIRQELEIVRTSGLKRSHDVICDYSQGLPTCKEPKISENR